MRSQRISNQPYDEAVSIESDGDYSARSDDAGGVRHEQAPAAGGADTRRKASSNSEAAERIMRRSIGGALGGTVGDATAGGFANLGLMVGDDAAATGTAKPADASSMSYDKTRYANLNVPQDVRELFQYMDRYNPEVYDIETVLKPFIPEFIASIGDIDGFLKVPRPDDKHDSLALAVVDEPSAKQSDPTVVALQLRANSRRSNVGPVEIRTVQPDKEPKEIAAWIANIAEMHSKKPLPAVHYTRAMPDIEQLMQEWPPAFEEALRSTALPSAELDVDLPTFAKIACLLLDIPISDASVIESLHVLFTLYIEARAHQGVNVDALASHA